jgi:hypothetical protein
LTVERGEEIPVKSGIGLSRIRDVLPGKPREIYSSIAFGGESNTVSLQGRNLLNGVYIF